MLGSATSDAICDWKHGSGSPRPSSALGRPANCRHPALDANAAAWAILILGDADIDPAAISDIPRIIDIFAFAETEGDRVRA